MQIPKSFGHFGILVDFLMALMTDGHPSFDNQHVFAASAPVVALRRGLAARLTIFVDELAPWAFEHELLAQFSIFKVNCMSLRDFLFLFLFRLGFLFDYEPEATAFLASLSFAGFAFLAGPEPRSGLLLRRHVLLTKVDAERNSSLSSPGVAQAMSGRTTHPLEMPFPRKLSCQRHHPILPWVLCDDAAASCGSALRANLRAECHASVGGQDVIVLDGLAVHGQSEGRGCADFLKVVGETANRPSARTKRNAYGALHAPINQCDIHGVLVFGVVCCECPLRSENYSPL